MDLLLEIFSPWKGCRVCFWDGGDWLIGNGSWMVRKGVLKGFGRGSVSWPVFVGLPSLGSWKNLLMGHALVLEMLNKLFDSNLLPFKNYVYLFIFNASSYKGRLSPCIEDNFLFFDIYFQFTFQWTFNGGTI